MQKLVPHLPKNNTKKKNNFLQNQAKKNKNTYGITVPKDENPDTGMKIREKCRDST
jgi:hypothetical protein